MIVGRDMGASKPLGYFYNSIIMDLFDTSVTLVHVSLW